MKTAVSLPDDVFAEAEACARRHATSRSQLYAAALREYLARHHPDRVTAALNRVYAAESEPLDPTLAATAMEAHERSEW